LIKRRETQAGKGLQAGIFMDNFGPILLQKPLRRLINSD
jgi:hypothetical protein